MKTYHLGKLRFHFSNICKEKDLNILEGFQIFGFEVSIKYKFIDIILFNFELEIDW